MYNSIVQAIEENGIDNVRIVWKEAPFWDHSSVKRVITWPPRVVELSERKHCVKDKWNTEHILDSSSLTLYADNEDYYDYLVSDIDQNIENGACKVIVEYSVSELFDKLSSVIPSEHISSYQSDLYVKKTPQSTPIIEKYEYINNVTTFKSNLGDGMWYDIPFAYMPYWEKKVQRSNRLSATSTVEE